MPTKEQLQKRVRELEAENDELHDQLDQIFNIVAPEVGDGDGGDEDKDDDSGED
jgi:heme oxygenase